MEQKFVTVPFDIEKAKAIQNGELEGKIVTRDGRSVRIVCFDRKSYEYPIVALIEKDSIENYGVFCIDGRLNISGNDANGDLFLQLPEYLTFKDGDVLSDEYGYILVLNTNRVYRTSFYACINISEDVLFDGAMAGDKIERFTLATKSEKQKLIEALKSCDDKRAEECLKKLGVEVKSKCELKPFDKVLCRAAGSFWVADLFSHIRENGEFVCIGAIWKHCIPYEGNEHLLGTNKSADE